MTHPSSCPEARTWTDYVAGETPIDDEPALASHLADCPDCRARCRDLAAIDCALSDASTQTCPPADIWPRYIAGETPLDDEPALAGHLAACPDCAAAARALATTRPPTSRPPLWPAAIALLALAVLLATPRPTQQPTPDKPTPAPITEPPKPPKPPKPPTPDTSPIPGRPVPLAEMLRRDVVPPDRRPRAIDDRLERALAGHHVELPLAAASELTRTFRATADPTHARRAGHLLLTQFGRSGRAFLLRQLDTPRGPLAAELLLGDDATTRALRYRAARLSDPAQRALLGALPDRPDPRHLRWITALTRRGRQRPDALRALARIDHPDTVDRILAASPRQLPPPSAAGLDRSALLRARLNRPPDVIDALTHLRTPHQRQAAIPHLIAALADRRTRDAAHAALVRWTDQSLRAHPDPWRRWQRKHQPRDPQRQDPRRPR